MTPTPEQQAIIDFATSRTENLLVSALAGSAKTTTLELICYAVTGIPILSLAFNKRIADEMTKRLPSHVQPRTMNALGHRVWTSAIGRRPVVDVGKNRTILKAIIDELPRNQRGEAYSVMADTLDAIRAAKRDGYVPPKWRGLAYGYNAGPLQQWVASLDEDPTKLQCELIDLTLSASIEAAYAGGIDYDDQIYMPVCFGAAWPKYPLVLVDEAQDLSPLNHEMLVKLVTQRVIAVGDPWQSIYGFRGAVANGMTALKQRFSMEELRLSVSFRVPRLGVERAWSRVPHMRWRDDAPDGRIERLHEWDAAVIPDDGAIICRNNAPLFSCALRLLAAGRSIKLVGMDIGPNLLRIMRKLRTDVSLEDAIDVWYNIELQRARSLGILAEKRECLRVLCSGRKDLADALRWTEDLFKQDGHIQLLSGHKAKGLEWDTVFHLDPWRIPSKFVREGTEEWEQEMNVRYVIETRFKKELYLIDMEGWQ